MLYQCYAVADNGPTLFPNIFLDIKTYVRLNECVSGTKLNFGYSYIVLLSYLGGTKRVKRAIKFSPGLVAIIPILWHLPSNTLASFMSVTFNNFVISTFSLNTKLSVSISN